jgi:hypothetical protein
MDSSVLNWLDQHGGAVVAISTALYTLMTVLLLVESRLERRQRREALVEVFPLRNTESRGQLLELRIENFGPGMARDVDCEYWFADGAHPLEGSRKRNGAAFAPSRGSIAQPRRLTCSPPVACDWSPAGHGPTMAEGAFGGRARSGARERGRCRC